MEGEIILKGITFDQLVDAIRVVVKEEIKPNMEVYEITKRGLAISLKSAILRLKNVWNAKTWTRYTIPTYIN